MQVKVDHESRIDVSELFRPAILPTDGVPDLQLLVAGEWRAAAKGEMFEVRSPIDGNLIARAAKASGDDVEEAIAAARQARDGFRGLPAAARLEICARAAEILEEHAESFISAIVADLGKTSEQAASEVKATRERLGLAREEVRKIFGEYLPGDWIADSVGKSAVVLREPVGTVAAFGPFNYPLYLAASQDHPSPGGGEHRRGQGAFRSPDSPGPLRSGLRGSGPAAGRAERHHRPGQRDRQRARLSRRRLDDLVHGLHLGRPQHRRRGRTQAHASRARGQRRRHRPGRRRSRSCCREVGAGSVQERRPAL